MLIIYILSQRIFLKGEYIFPCDFIQFSSLLRETFVISQTYDSGGGSKGSDSDLEDETEKSSIYDFNTIKIHHVTTDELDLIVKFLNINKDTNISYYKSPQIINNTNDYYNSIGKDNVTFFTNITNCKKILSLSNAANFMGIDMLVLGCCSWIAYQFTSNPINYMNEYLYSDINSEQLEQITNEEIDYDLNNPYFTTDDLKKLNTEFKLIQHFL